MPQVTWHCFRGKLSKQSGESQTSQDEDSRFRPVVNQDDINLGYRGGSDKNCQHLRALQLIINFQVPPSVASFKSILDLFILKHVYGIVCPLSLWAILAQLASCNFATPSSRSRLLPTGEQHESHLGATDESHSACPEWKIVLLALFSQNVCS